MLGSDRITLECMSVVADPETLAELISDCADLPDSVRYPTVPDQLPAWGLPVAWQVSDECFAQVDGLDDYGS